VIWEIRKKVADPAFVFERNIAYEKRRLVFTDHYRALVDEIPAQDTVRYAGNLARAREATGYQLYWTDIGRSEASGFQRFNWLVALLGTLALIAWIRLAIAAYRYDPPKRMAAVNPSLRGIRGWLLLPAFNVLTTPFALLLTLAKSAHAWAADTWVALTTYGGAQYHVLWAPCLLFELVANLGLLVYAILLIVLFFQRRRTTPFFYVAFLAAMLTVQVIDHVFVYWLPMTSSDGAGAIQQIFGGAIGAMIWGAYFFNSQRVKSTFVEGRAKRVEAEMVSTPV